MVQEIISLPGIPQSVRIARRHVIDFLCTYPLDLDGVVLLVSETVTNAICHTNSKDGNVCLSVSVDDDGVRVEVLDGGSNTHPMVTPGDGEGGRGLLLVEQYARKWGCATGTYTGLVWFELERLES